MKSMALALPVKDRQAGLKVIDDILRDQADTHHQKRLEHGFQRAKIYLQHRPQEMVIFYLEADNVDETLAKRHADEDEFEQYVNQMIEKVTGHDIRAIHADGPPVELVLDWHPEKGAAKSHH
jgi:hypothetical protein